MRSIATAHFYLENAIFVMIEIAVQLVVVAAALAVVYFILQAAFTHRFQFMIQIVGNDLRVTKGKVPAEFLDNVRVVCSEFRVTTGWIGGVKRGKATALRFSSHFSAQCQQRLRNIWFCP